jgi:hypothetical protein
MNLILEIILSLTLAGFLFILPIAMVKYWSKHENNSNN